MCYRVCLKEDFIQSDIFSQSFLDNNSGQGFDGSRAYPRIFGHEGGIHSGWNSSPLLCERKPENLDETYIHIGRTCTAPHTQ